MNYIETKRLILRPWQFGDIEELAKGLNEFEVAKNLVTPYPYTTEHAKDFITKNLNVGENGKYNLAVVEKASGKVIGGTGIDIKETGIGGGGIWLKQAFQGKGYGTEIYVARAIFGFKTLNLNEIQESYYTHNMASKALHQKLGYEETGEIETDFNHALATDVKGVITTLTKERFFNLAIYKNADIEVEMEKIFTQYKEEKL